MERVVRDVFILFGRIFHNGWGGGDEGPIQINRTRYRKRYKFVWENFKKVMGQYQI
jgi:hypothetical protein